MGYYENLRLRGFDHLELAVADLERACEFYVHWGFERVGAREIRERQLRSVLMSQNGAHLLLSHSTLASDPVAKYLAAHGEGVFAIAFACEDAVSVLEHVTNRGARVADVPKSISRDFGTTHQASIYALGNLRHRFISRQGALFAEGFDIPLRAHPKGFGLERLDHFRFVVEMAQSAKWFSYYENVLGLGRSGTTLRGSDGLVGFELVEADADPRATEFIEVHHGPGVEHIAFSTSNLPDSLRAMRREKLEFTPSPPGTADEHRLLGIHPATEGDLFAFSSRASGALGHELVQRTSRHGVDCGWR